MSDDLENNNAGIEVQGEAAPQAEAAPQSAPAAQADDIEVRARAQGWVPKEEFRGPAENWRDAEEFVRRGEEETPILRERNRDLSRKVAELEAKVNTIPADYERKLQTIERMSQAALIRQREQIEASYQAAMRNAVESGDVVRYDQLSSDKVRALQGYDQQVNEHVYRTQEQAQPQPPNGQRPLPPQDQAVVESWVKSNAWFLRDEELKAVATAHHGKLNREKPGMSLQENLAEVSKYVRQRYSDKFSHPSQQFGAAAMVEGGSRVPVSSRQSRGVSTLTAEERKAGERFVSQGLFKNLSEYAQELYSDA